MEDILKKLPDLETGIDDNLNINISYRIKKKLNKPYLVFLHGYNGSSKSWVFQFEYFSKFYSVENKRSYKWGCKLVNPNIIQFCYYIVC